MRAKILAFIESKKQYPVVSAIASGLYPFLFYYNSNFNQVNSWSQFLFFISVFVLIPTITFILIYKILQKIKLVVFLKYLLPVLNIGWFGILMLKSSYGLRLKYILLVIVLTLVISFLFKKHFKKIIVLQLLMAVLAFGLFVNTIFNYLTYSKKWLEQPDAIQSVLFKQKPNVYMIQVDGYANVSELNKEPYNINNSEFEKQLINNGFKLYNNYRSNYSSTLTSNASMFNMKHHYYHNSKKPFKELLYSRENTVGENSVLSIFKNNNYKTHLIIERPYFIVNRPKLAFDYCNILYKELPYLDKGFGVKKNIKTDFLKVLKTNKNNPNFYFIQKLLPSHITNSNSKSIKKENEREKYIQRLNDANIWLDNIIEKIEQHDDNALIIISADHGGFVGFNNTTESAIKQQDSNLIRSIFSATLAIKWKHNQPEFDYKFKSPVNIFRLLFTHLSQDEKYLNHLQPNESYIILNKKAIPGVYKYINENNQITFDAFSK